MPPPTPDLAGLLRRLLDGSEDAARELVARYSAVIRHVIRSHLGRRARPALDPEDLTQQVWASFFRRGLHRGWLGRPGALRAFLCAWAATRPGRRRGTSGPGSATGAGRCRLARRRASATDSNQSRVLAIG